MNNSTDQTLGKLVREHIIETHGNLDPNTIIAFTGCNEQTAKTIAALYHMDYPKKDDAA